MSKFIVSRNISAFEDLSKKPSKSSLESLTYPKNHVWNPKNVICIPQKLFGILFLSACNIGRLYFLAQHTRKICTTRHGLCSRGSMMWNVDKILQYDPRSPRPNHQHLYLSSSDCDQSPIWSRCYQNYLILLLCLIHLSLSFGDSHSSFSLDLIDLSFSLGLKLQFWLHSFELQLQLFELQHQPQLFELQSQIFELQHEPQLSTLQPQRLHSSSWKRCQSSSPIKILLLCQSYLVVSSFSDICLNQNLQSSASSNSCPLTVGDSCAYMSLFTHPSLICKFICLLSCGNWSLKNCSAMLCPTTYRLSSTQKCCWFSVLPLIRHQDYMSSLSVWLHPITRF